jgi:hypothetical protein
MVEQSAAASAASAAAAEGGGESATSEFNGGTIITGTYIIYTWLADGAKRVCHIFCRISGHIKKRNKQVSISSGTQNVKKMSDMRVDGSLQKKKEKNNKSARTHPAYRQIWDTLLKHEDDELVLIVLLFWLRISTFMEFSPLR